MNYSLRNLTPQKVYRYFRRYYKPYPDQINLQLCSTCNFRCKHCLLYQYGKTIPVSQPKMLNYEDSIKQIDHLDPAIKKAKCILLSLFETLIHKDVFRIMDYILEINPNIQFPILTNTKAVDETILKQLENYPIFEFLVSLDGAKKETVENFKIGASYEHIIETLEAALKTDFADKVGTVFVLHKNNKDELPDYMDLVGSIGVKKVFLNNLLAFTTDFADDYLYKSEGNPEVQKLFDICIEKAKDYDIELWLPSLKPELQGCRTSEFLNVDINGNVTPCDFLATRTPFEFLGKSKFSGPVVFGNVYEEDALKIYRSKPYRNFRLRHRIGKDIPEECTHCIDAYGLLCSQRAKAGS